MSKKHYEIIAEWINKSTMSNNSQFCNKLYLMQELSKEFKEDNKLFNAEKFINACIDK
tara:strand:+ start:255 stop:428 length:174 start_codon:yes stop_codon:yes gene_type:complete